MLDYDIRRGGGERAVEGPYPFPAMVGSVTPNSAAMDAGLAGATSSPAIDGTQVFAFEQLFARCR